MKHRGMMLALAATMSMAAGMAVQGGATQTQVSPSSAAQPGGGNQPAQSQAGGSTATARQRFASGYSMAGGDGRYRRRPKGSVARDKRDAARARNKARRP